MLEPFNPSRSPTALEQDSTVIAVIEMSQSKWLVAAVIPGVERRTYARSSHRPPRLAHIALGALP